MMINVSDIKNLITELQTHYEKHINNKYLKNVIMKVDLNTTSLQNMNLILAGNMVYIDSRGALEDLYYGIKAICEFINEIQTKIMPNLGIYGASNFLGSNQNVTQNEKILSQMAVKNYPMNVKMFFDLVYKLFNMINEFDKINFPKDPAYKRIQNFPQLEKLIAELKERNDKHEEDY